MRLHESRVAGGIVGCGDADAATGLLHDDSEDEAGVGVCFVGDEESGVMDRGDFVGAVGGDGVDSARCVEEGAVNGEPVRVKNVSRWETRRDGEKG